MKKSLLDEFVEAGLISERMIETSKEAQNSAATPPAKVDNNGGQNTTVTNLRTGDANDASQANNDEPKTDAPKADEPKTEPEPETEKPKKLLLQAAYHGVSSASLAMDEMMGKEGGMSEYTDDSQVKVKEMHQKLKEYKMMMGEMLEGKY